MPNVTRLLQDAESGDPRAAEQLLPLVYEELRRLAARRLASEANQHTLQPTALVHEAWLKISGNEARSWNGRGHFFAAAAEAMRRILVDRARRRLAVKRGAGAANLDADELESDLSRLFVLPIREAARSKLAFSPDGQVLAVSLGAELSVWDLSARRLRFERRTRLSILWLAFAPDGQTLASAGSDRTVLRVPLASRLNQAGRLAGKINPPSKRWRRVVGQSQNVSLAPALTPSGDDKVARLSQARRRCARRRCRPLARSPCSIGRS